MEHIQHVVDAYNLTPHSSTGYAPYYLMFGRQRRQPIDLLLGTGHQDLQTDWATEHQRRLQEAYALARGQMEKEADQRKACFDRTARDLPLLYRRKRGILGRNKIQDAWDDTEYKVICRQGTNDVYTIVPVDGSGERRTVHRSSLRPCVTGNDVPTVPAPPRRRRRRRLPSIPPQRHELPDSSDDEQLPWRCKTAPSTNRDPADSSRGDAQLPHPTDVDLSASFTGRSGRRIGGRCPTSSFPRRWRSGVRPDHRNRGTDNPTYSSHSRSTSKPVQRATVGVP